MKKTIISEKATISENVILGKNVLIEPGVTICAGCIVGDNVTIREGSYLDYGTIIRENVEIGKNSFVGASCILGEYLEDFFVNFENKVHELKIGDYALIRSGSIIYGGTEIGTHFQTGHRVTIREGAIIGNHVHVGTLSDIQGYCRIGNYVRMHSNVHIGQESDIEDFVWIFPYVVLTNDPTPPSNELKGVKLKQFAVVGTGSVLLPGVVVGSDTLIAAGAVVTKNVEIGDVVGGNPARVISNVSRIKNHITGEQVYPWRNTFKRGMPWEETDYDSWYKEVMNSLEIDK